jgi:hypothetical protein
LKESIADIYPPHIRPTTLKRTQHRDNYHCFNRDELNNIFCK